MKIVHPDKDILDLIRGILHDYTYHICKVECSFDYINLNHDETMEFFKFSRDSVYILYRGKAFSPDYSTTKYWNNVYYVRSAGIKGYIRKEGFYRLEVTAKTPYLRSMGINRIEDLDKLVPSKITERISYRLINYQKWRKHFHHLPEQNNRYSDDEVQNKIESILRSKTLKDAVLYASKFTGGKAFLDIHPFQPIFKAAIQDPFIKDVHPESIPAFPPSHAESEMVNLDPNTDLVDWLAVCDPLENPMSVDCSIVDDGILPESTDNKGGCQSLAADMECSVKSIHRCFELDDFA